MNYTLRTPLREDRDASFQECISQRDIQRWYKKVGRHGWISFDKESPFANRLYLKAMALKQAST